MRPGGRSDPLSTVIHPDAAFDQMRAVQSPATGHARRARVRRLHYARREYLPKHSVKIQNPTDWLGAWL